MLLTAVPDSCRLTSGKMPRSRMLQLSYIRPISDITPDRPANPMVAPAVGAGDSFWFKISANAGRLFYHENGHVMFGLIDTYCGDTYYVENDPDPNVWSSEGSCAASAKADQWDPSICHQISGMISGSSSGTCIKQFWNWDPEPDIMGNGAYSGTFGNASTTRMRYIFDSINGGKA